mgnify:CR=1 FL=1
MRIMARLAAVSSCGRIGLFERAVAIMKSWIDSKYVISDGIATSKRSGERAQIFENQISGNGGTLYRLSTREKVKGASFQVETHILQTDRIIIQTEIGVGEAEGRLAVPSFQLASPRFFQEVLSIKDAEWRFRVGADRLSPEASLVDAKEIDSLIAHLEAEDRQLPIILVSRDQAGELVDELSDRIARNGAGLAHTVSITAEASDLLSERFGKSWSCFNHGVRLYWPDLDFSDSPYLHKLWTADRLRQLRPDHPNFLSRVSLAVLRPALAASSYTARISDIFDFKRSIARQHFERAAIKAKKENDYDVLEQLYAQENDRLESENAQLKMENETLQQNIAALIKSQKAKTSARKNEPAKSPEEFDSISEAISFAMERPDSRLNYPDDLYEQIQTIHEAAAPPDKILKCLSALEDLAEELSRTSGSLGMSVVGYLKDKGQDCSIESETSRNAGLFEFSVGGKKMDFELHLKPTNATAPDRCIRIYFRPSADNKSIDIGYIGSKKGLKL